MRRGHGTSRDIGADTEGTTGAAGGERTCSSQDANRGSDEGPRCASASRHAACYRPRNGSGGCGGSSRSADRSRHFCSCGAGFSHHGRTLVEGSWIIGIQPGESHGADVTLDEWSW